MKRYFIPLQVLLMLPFIGAAQNVGIGTTSPVEKLHVVGNIKVDSIKPNAIKLLPNAGAGKLLTSDAAGNASWQDATAVNNSNIGFGVWGDCATNGNISEYDPVTDADGSFGDQFGSSVSMSGNFAIVGAPYDDVGINPDQGSASIYQYNGVTWEFMQKITDVTGAVGDLFGYSVSISGNYAIIGAYAADGIAGANQGSASIYQYNGTDWELMEKIFDADGDAFDNFGYSVSISGTTAVAGALNDDGPAGMDQGSVSVYQFDGTSWVLIDKLLDATGAGGDFFGSSVSTNETYIIAGAYGDNGPGGANQGSASIYQFNGSNWVLMKKLTDAAGSMNDQFGISVSLSGEYALIGAYVDNGPGGASQGSAGIYRRIGTGWQKLQSVVDPGGSAGDFFGGAASIDDQTKRFLLGASNYGNNGGKIIFGKIN